MLTKQSYHELPQARKRLFDYLVEGLSSHNLLRISVADRYRADPRSLIMPSSYNVIFEQDGRLIIYMGDGRRSEVAVSVQWTHGDFHYEVSIKEGDSYLEKHINDLSMVLGLSVSEIHFGCTKIIYLRDDFSPALNSEDIKNEERFFDIIRNQFSRLVAETSVGMAKCGRFVRGRMLGDHALIYLENSVVSSNLEDAINPIRVIECDNRNPFAPVYSVCSYDPEDQWEDHLEQRLREDGYHATVVKTEKVFGTYELTCELIEPVAEPKSLEAGSGEDIKLDTSPIFIAEQKIQDRFSAFNSAVADHRKDSVDHRFPYPSWSEDD